MIPYPQFFPRRKLRPVRRFAPAVSNSIGGAGNDVIIIDGGTQGPPGPPGPQGPQGIQGIPGQTGPAGSCSDLSVLLTSSDYSCDIEDEYIGVVDTISNKTVVTLPPGVIGKVFTIKNQTPGNGKVTVIGSNGELIDTFVSRDLGTQVSIQVIFDGTRWNII